MMHSLKLYRDRAIQIIDKHRHSPHNSRLSRLSGRIEIPISHERLLRRGLEVHPLTQTETTRGLRTAQSEPPATAETSASVSKVEEGAFINLTSAIQSIHLNVWVTVESSGTLRQESVSLADERALVHAAGRLFSKGAAEEATKQIRQAQSGFNRKKAEWESRVRRSEDDSTRRRAMRELHQKRGNHNPIGTRIPPAENQFRRLIEALDIHVSLERKREIAIRKASLKSASPASAEREQIALPAGFLEAFSGAEAGRQETILKQFFDVEAELTVKVTSTKAKQKQKTAAFRPRLPKNRLYYLVDTAQVIRLRRVKITNDVYYHNFAAQQNQTMSLQFFIESVQAGGVWLLQPKSDSIETVPDARLQTR